MQRFGRLFSLPSPRQVAVYLEGAAVDGTLAEGHDRYDAPVAHRLHHWTCCRAAAGIADRALEGVAGHHRNAGPRSTDDCRVSAGSRSRCCGSDKPKPPCFSSW